MTTETSFGGRNGYTYVIATSAEAAAEQLNREYAEADVTLRVQADQLNQADSAEMAILSGMTADTIRRLRQAAEAGQLWVRN